MAPDAVIAQVLKAEPTLQRACQRLIELANKLGGTDNVTVVVTRYVGD
jgi:serine/threonine protein phosphatase PrpC